MHARSGAQKSSRAVNCDDRDGRQADLVGVFLTTDVLVLLIAEAEAVQAEVDANLSNLQSDSPSEDRCY